MLIRCLQERQGGTVIHLDGGPRRGYHFKPGADGGDHVCEVADLAHIKLFIGIPEGYAPADGEKLPAGIAVPAPPEPIPRPPLNPDEMSNRDLQAWCVARGLNWRVIDTMKGYARANSVDLAGVPDRWTDISRALVTRLGA